MKKVYTVSEQVKIKNEKGTADRSCGCGGWLNHWKEFGNKIANTCSVAGCTQAATVGAHVTRPQATNEAYKTHSYIVPMCSAHNGKHGETFNSKANVTFVWANVQETCGK